MMQLLGEPGQHPEGLFFPDTYLFDKGTSDLEILRQSRAPDEAPSCGRMGRPRGRPALATPYEALILASIVEKETALAAERARIGGVFAERLRRGMRLQTDPTVIYGIGAKFDGNLRRSDLERDGPYNTYMRAGLPPDTDRPARGRVRCAQRCARRARRDLLRRDRAWRRQPQVLENASPSTSRGQPSTSRRLRQRTGGAECDGVSSRSRAAKASARDAGRRAAAWLRAPASRSSIPASPVERRARSVCASCCSSDARTDATGMRVAADVCRARHCTLRTSSQPALARGAWVLCDRFTDATYAYQGGGRGMARAEIDALARIAHPAAGTRPDRAARRAGRARAGARRGTPGVRPTGSRPSGWNFSSACVAAYLERARREPGRIRIIDAAGTIDEVEAAVRSSTGAATDMSERENQDAGADHRSTAALACGGARAAARSAVEGGRLPHALLLQGPAGVGKEQLRAALAAALLCTGRARGWRLAGRCAECALSVQGRIRTCMVRRPEEIARRSRSTRSASCLRTLAMTSMRAGFRVAIVSPAHMP